MLSRPMFVAALLLLVSLASAQSPDSTDARVAGLVKKLGSGSYMLRESARKELESLGVDSLDALKRAREGADTETSRRLGNIIGRFEEQILTKQILTPKIIHLTIKDATPQQAIAELTKVSGYPIQFQGDAVKLGTKKLTLDIKAPFWQVLDRINREAGLVERGDGGLQNITDPRYGNVRVIRGGIARAYTGNPNVAPAGPVIVIPRTNENPIVDFRGAVKTELRASRDAKTKELILDFTVGIEPRLLNGVVAGKPTIAKMTLANGQPLEQIELPSIVESDVAMHLANTASLAPRRNSAQFRFKNPGHAVAIKELSGQFAITVDLQNEIVAKFPDILNAAGKSAGGSNGGELTVLAIQKTPAGDYEVRVSMNGLTPSPFGNNIVINGAGGVIIRGNVQINGGIVIGPNGVRMGGTGNRKDLPDLVDAKGQKFQVLTVTADTTTINNGGVVRTATIVYRPNPGQDTPRDLILFGTRNHAIAVPFRFENVDLGSR